MKLSETENEALSILMPDLGEELSRDIIQHRKGLKCPLTPGGAKSLLKQYKLTGSPVSAAEEHLNRGWQGFKAEWLTRGKGFVDSNNPMPRGKPISDFMKTQIEIKQQLERKIYGEHDEFAGSTIDLDIAPTDCRPH